MRLSVRGTDEEQENKTMEKIEMKNFGKTGIVRAICISTVRGVEKKRIDEGHFLRDFGIEGDAHAGNWHRQVSLLSYDRVEAFNARGAEERMVLLERIWSWRELTFAAFLWEHVWYAGKLNWK